MISQTEPRISQAKSAHDQMEDAFSLGEANMKLEGFDPASDALYRDLKREIIEGKIDFDEAVDLAVRSVSRKSQPTAA
jgi:hypothetical protein